MAHSIRLFNVAGIEIRVHLTFPFLLIWAAYHWGSISENPLQGAVFGVTLILLLFVAVTLHELGHSLEAKRLGVTVTSITLLPIGGVAQMEEIPEQPGRELRIALAGPLVNLLIAAGLVALALVLNARAVLTLDELRQALGTTSWAGMLAYLTTANLAMAVFNLIPAFPLDGGRVLRALLATRMDYVRATRLAAAIGQSFAWILGLWGAIAGSWNLLLIAVFVWMGAGGEARTVQVRSTLRKVKVRQAMSPRPLTIGTVDPLRRAVDLVLSSPQADLPVQHGDRVVGVLTREDLLAGLRAGGADASVGSAMHTTFPAVGPDEGIDDAYRKMTSARIRAIPVIEHERLTGLLTLEDVGEVYGLTKAAQSARLHAARERHT